MYHVARIFSSRPWVIYEETHWRIETFVIVRKIVLQIGEDVKNSTRSKMCPLIPKSITVFNAPVNGTQDFAHMKVGNLLIRAFTTNRVTRRTMYGPLL